MHKSASSRVSRALQMLEGWDDKDNNGDVPKAAADKGNQTNGMEDGMDDPFHQTKRGEYIQ